MLPLLTELGERFAAGGHEIALVGGPVRDAFLGRVSPDLDFTTDASPDEILALVSGWADAHWDIGRDFGTIGLRKGALTIEITTYRADVYDRTSRKPEVMFGDSLEGDLVRRDFTVNAMALRLPELEFVDVHGGLADLAARRLHDPGGAGGVLRRRPAADDARGPVHRPARLRRRPRGPGRDDRPRREPRDRSPPSGSATSSSKLLLSAQPRAGLALLVDTGLAEVFLPELPALRLELDEHHRHKDVYDHSLIVLEQAIALEGPADGPPESVPGPDLVLRLAALLHDIGKPATRRFEDGGGVSFHHHELVGAKLAGRRLKALRYDKDTIKAVSRLVELHLRFHGYGEGQWTDSAVRRYVTDAGPLLPRLHRLTRSDSTTRNVRKADPALPGLRRPRGPDRAARRAGGARRRAARARRQRDRRGARGSRPARSWAQAYRYLLSVRLDDGLIGPDAARAKLLAWWAARETP